MYDESIENLFENALDLLKNLIGNPSFSKNEEKTRVILQDFLIKNNINFDVIGNNIWVKNTFFNSELPTILLNSHHDTVKPNNGYTIDPFLPIIKNEKLYGLGSNDAGGALVALLATFIYFNKHNNLPYNLIWAASAEEEISGFDGIELLLKHLPIIDLAIVGEPTHMDMAVAEKGLLVLDCVIKGEAGHAARNEGINAIYLALKDIEWFKNYAFNKVSDTLGPIKMSVTQINAGTQHNVVPDDCHFVVDVRTTDAYSLEDTLKIIKENVSCSVTPRSVRLKPSGIDITHPIVLKGKQLGMKTYGSPTLSDQALMQFTSIKIGPGDSARSHTADEFIYVHEIKNGIMMYIQLLENLKI